MKKTIVMDESDLGQIVDCLICRADDYERTVRYHETGELDDYILEVRDAAEARNLARCYRQLIEELISQLR